MLTAHSIRHKQPHVRVGFFADGGGGANGRTLRMLFPCGATLPLLTIEEL